MPILDIEIVLQSGEALHPNLASRLAETAAEIFESPPGGTWVKLRSLPHLNYAEDAGGPPQGVAPVFVTVLKAERPEAGQMESEVQSLTEAIARVCNRPPANVHVIYQPDAKGRLAFGGNIVRSG